MITMYAWIGEDEEGSGKVGIKQAMTPAGMIPLAAMNFHLDRLAKLMPVMEAQAAASGMKLRLMKFASTGEFAAETKAGTWNGDAATVMPEADVQNFFERLSASAKDDIIPKMQQSLFCLIPLHGPDSADIFQCMQVGLALMLDKPLVVVATGNAPVSKRLRLIADVIVEGESLSSEALRQKTTQAVGEMLRRRGIVQ